MVATDDAAMEPELDSEQQQREARKADKARRKLAKTQLRVPTQSGLSITIGAVAFFAAAPKSRVQHQLATSGRIGTSSSAIRRRTPA